MTRAGQSSYEDLPYEDHAYFHTHPSNLAVVATLCGLQAPSIARCRVLELGCGTGFNLLAMAQSLPDASFVGIDMSERQIAMGQTTARAIRCRNVDLQVGNAAQLATTLGEFDYIVAHGLFSWVPDEVRRAIVKTCKRHLSLAGLAYISFNTFPGWHQRTLLRDILRFHARADALPLEQVRQARAGLIRLVQDLPDFDTDYSRFLKSEAESLSSDPDTYVFHEFLAANNEPLRFEEFAAMMRAGGLQFVAEARFNTNTFVQDAGMQARLAAAGGELIRREQYHDFLRNRFFRQSLLCHDCTHPTWMPAIGQVQQLWLRIDKSAPHATDPMTCAIQRAVQASWPRPVPIADITSHIQESSQVDVGALVTAIVRGYVEGYWQLYAFNPPFITTAGDQPMACPLARHQSELTSEVTNRLHRPVILTDEQLQTLRLLDGQSTRADLVTRLLFSNDQLDRCLQALADAALIVELFPAEVGQR